MLTRPIPDPGKELRRETERESEGQTETETEKERARARESDSEMAAAAEQDGLPKCFMGSSGGTDDTLISFELGARPKPVNSLTP